MLKPLCIALAIGFSAITASFAQEGGGAAPGAVKDYVVAPQNRFVQITLTPQLVDRALAAFPDYGRIVAQQAEEMLANYKSEKNEWDKAVASIALNKKIEAEFDALVARHGFKDRLDFEQTLFTLMIAAAPEALAPMGENSLRVLSGFRQSGSGFFVPANVKPSLERSISIAQQEPLPENKAVIAPMMAKVKAALKPQTW